MRGYTFFVATTQNSGARDTVPACLAFFEMDDLLYIFNLGTCRLY